MAVLSVRAVTDLDTLYSSYWLSLLEPQLGAVVLADEDCTAEKFQEAISNYTPDKLVITGHGSPRGIEGWNGELVLNLGNAGLAAGMDCFLVSCSTYELANAMRNAGARSVIFFTRELAWASSGTSPASDTLDDDVQEFVHVIARTLVSYGPSEAYRAGHEFATQRALELQMRGGEEAEERATWLIWDRDHLGLLSDELAIVPEESAEPLFAAAVASFLSLLAVFVAFG